MNLAYKILWFEDERDFVDAYIPDLQEYIEKLGFKFVRPQVEKDSSNEEKLEFNEFDLILMDYKLGDENKGDVIINKIRNLNVYTEIIFYSSSEMKELRSSIHDNELDGVYCVNRGAGFLPKVKDIINLTLKKVLDLNAMRGVVMAEVSDFDKKMIKIIETYLSILSEEESIKFTDGRRKKAKGSLEDRIKKIETLTADEFYRSPSFEANQKWIAVLGIVKDKYKIFEECTKLYETEIIRKRNLLGHVTETTDENGIKQLSNGDFVFNDETCQRILNDLKKHDENFSRILKSIK